MAVKAKAAWSSAAARRLIEVAGGDLTLEDAIVRVVAQLRGSSSGPPTNLREIGDQLGVEPWSAEPLPVAGELRHEGGKLKIAYASGLPSGRRRFTIAHELGHAFFERSGPRCPRRGKELERICDLFAVELLMPAAQIGEVFAPRTPDSVFEAAERFDVSITAAMYRFAELTRSQAVLDNGRQRSGTIRALTVPHPGLDSLIDESRRNRQAEAVVRLDRNQSWNGSWLVRASNNARGHLVLVTARPVNPDSAP
jgi:hypothetical protein